MKEIKGKLHAWYEQGMEAQFICTLIPDDAPTDPNQTVFFSDKHNLTVFNEDGSTLWSGPLNMVRKRFWEAAPKNIKVGTGTKPKGVAYADWITWFIQQRRAIVHIPE